MLSFSSFNIRCFGLGGEYNGRFRDEKRQFDLKNMFHDTLKNIDVMIFQEIVDVASFKMLIPNNYNLYHYDHEYERHQNVVFAVKNNHQVIKKELIPCVAIDDTVSRPAFHLEIDVENNGVVNMVGVHLKSGSYHTNTRLKQVKAICDYIDLMNKKTPFIIGGDFNTHRIESSEMDYDDLDYLSEVFSTVGIKWVENKIPTFQTSWSQNIIDHFFVSNSLLKKSEIEVFDLATKKMTFENYYQKISDHVPIILKTKL